MTLRLLTREEFLDTFQAPMRNVTGEDCDELDIWDYVDAIPLVSLDIIALGDVERVYRDATGRYDHALVWTDQKSRYLVVVIDIQRGQVHGHRVLDLNTEYLTN